MSSLATLVSTAAAVVAAAVAALAYVAGQRTERRRTRTEQQAADEQHLQAAIRTALQPLDATVASLAEQVRRLNSSHDDLCDKVSRQESTMADTRAKVDLFWAAVSKNAANMLHSPHPERFHIDRLLEKFHDAIDGKYVMTDDERARLRAELEYIVNLPHGETPKIPLTDGDKVAAALVLAGLDIMEAGHARTKTA